MQFSLYAVLTFAAALFTIWLATAIWSRRPGVGVNVFVVLAVGLTIWTFASGLELVITGYLGKIIAAQLVYVGVVIVIPAWLIFALQYAGHDSWITRRRVLFLLIEPILVHLLIMTNDLHGLIWETRALVSVNGFFVIDYTHGSGFWVHAIYSYVILLIGAVMLVRAFIRSPHLYRGQVQYLLIAIVAPWIANFLYVTGLSPLPPYYDLTPLAFVITVAAVAWSLYRFRLMDILPVARDLIVENMDDAIFVIDRSHRLLDLNRTALTLLRQPSPDAVIGRTLMDLVPAQANLVSQFREVHEADTDITTDVSGETRTFNVRITPLRNRQQELTARIVVLHDITTMSQANEQLKDASQKAEEANRLKSEFLATMSHELRTPLNAIIGFSEIQLMGMSGELNPTQRDYQSRVLANAQHLLGMINSILDLSKIEAGYLQVNNRAFDVRAWLDRVVHQNAVLARDKQLEFKVEIDPLIPQRLIADEDLLRQVMINLLSNALKFTKQGQVKVHLERAEGGRWCIHVTDTGIGIPADKVERIFTEFYQIDSSLTREFGGTGLGLAIVHRVVTAMGGEIRVQSSMGEGSTFTVTLPLLEDKPASSAASAAASMDERA